MKLFTHIFLPPCARLLFIIEAIIESSSVRYMAVRAEKKNLLWMGQALLFQIDALKITSTMSQHTMKTTLNTAGVSLVSYNAIYDA